MLRGVLLLGATLPLAGLGGAAASQVRNGRIAFDHLGFTGPFQIYSMTATGAHLRHLTSGNRYSHTSPSYSPRGKRIVFVRSINQGDLWTMNADGTHKRPLTSTARIDEDYPDWSPDGKRIVFAVTRPRSLKGIWAIGTDGRHRRRLTSGYDLGPSWSPDGNEIAFTRRTAQQRQTYYTGSVFVVPISGGKATDLSSDPGISDFDPDWSPDGKRILFASDRPTGGLDLWTMNADGTGVSRVTDTPELDKSAPVWSPDGAWVAYVGTDHPEHGSSSYQLYVSRPDGSNRRKITHACKDCGIWNKNPSWQPLP